MRWSSRIVLFLAVAVLLVVTAPSTLGAPAGPDLTLGSMSEPPDFRKPGTTFAISFTVVNRGGAGVQASTKVRFFLVKKAKRPGRRARRLRGGANIGELAPQDETTRRLRVRIRRGTPLGLYFLAGCADRGKAVKEASEKNNCFVSGQRVRIVRRRPSLAGPPGPPGPTGPRGPGLEQRVIPRTALPLGRATITGPLNLPATPKPGDDEKSNQRVELIKVGKSSVSVVADCKRTTNGDGGGPDDAFGAANSFDQDGDEAKILIYTDSGEVSFNSMGGSSRRNIPAGEGTPSGARDTGGQSEEVSGGEGKHMAIATARDPQQDEPENDWAFGYKVGSIYVSHSNGTEFILTAYVGIDVLGLPDQCVFGGVATIVNEV